MSSLKAFLVDPPRWYRWLLGVVAIAPFMFAVGSLGADMVTEHSTPSGEVWVSGVIVAWALLFYFVFDAALSGRVPEAKRRLWVVVLLLAHMFAVPFYWFFYLRPRAGGAASEA